MDTGRKAHLANNGNQGSERRVTVRKNCRAPVVLNHPAMGSLDMMLVNISDEGALLDSGAHSLPPVGTLVTVRFPSTLGYGDDALEMLVVHKRPGLLGLRFLASMSV